MINSHLQTGAATILIASLSLITILFLSRSCSGKSRDNFAPLATVSGPGTGQECGNVEPMTISQTDLGHIDRLHKDLGDEYRYRRQIDG